MFERGKMAAMRDASWWRCPGRAARYHILGSQIETAYCGTPALFCEAIPGDEVPLDLRCQRNGCRQGWPEGLPAQRQP